MQFSYCASYPDAMIAVAAATITASTASACALYCAALPVLSQPPAVELYCCTQQRSLHPSLVLHSANIRLLCLLMSVQVATSAPL
jgi:hypothetical protein